MSAEAMGARSTGLRESLAAAVFLCSGTVWSEYKPKRIVDPKRTGCPQPVRIVPPIRQVNAPERSGIIPHPVR
jgi:hypothetical protein